MVIVIAILFLMGALVGANPSIGNTVPVQPDTPVTRAMASALPPRDSQQVELPIRGI